MRSFDFFGVTTTLPRPFVVRNVPASVSRKRSGAGPFVETSIVPDITGPWTWQKYGKCPSLVNVNEKVSPGCITPEFQSPALAVDVCIAPPRLVQVTVSPGRTVRFFGAKKS